MARGGPRHLATLPQFLASIRFRVICRNHFLRNADAVKKCCSQIPEIQLLAKNCGKVPAHRRACGLLRSPFPPSALPSANLFGAPQCLAFWQKNPHTPCRCNEMYFNALTLYPRGDPSVKVSINKKSTSYSASPEVILAARVIPARCKPLKSLLNEREITRLSAAGNNFYRNQFLSLNYQLDKRISHSNPIHRLPPSLYGASHFIRPVPAGLSGAPPV